MKQKAQVGWTCQQAIEYICRRYLAVIVGYGDRERRSLNREVLSSNPTNTVSNLGQVNLPHVV